MKRTPSSNWFKPNFDIEVDTNLNTNNITELSNKKVKPKNIIKNEIVSEELFNINLLEKFAPKCVTDLAVHNKKVTEVEDWLKYYVINSNKISLLLLTGPAGAGKTATIQILCKTMNIKIIEWVNNVDIDFEEFRGPGQSVKFTEFLVNSSRYPSLLINSSKMSKQLILVEDFPNSVIHKPAEFENILEILNQKGKSSAVFICTETKDNSINISHQLFTDSIKQKFQITTINFNPVSVTLLKSALKRINSIIEEKYTDSYQSLPQETIESIVNSSMGDIRTALNYFNFACLKGSANLPTTVQLNQSIGSKRKRKDKDKEVVTNMSRDESLDLLHGVGRVLYPKRIETPYGWKLEKSPETITDQFITMPSMFVAFLHENYLRYFGSFNDVKDATNIFSFTERLLADWKDDNVTKNGLLITIMGIMIANNNSVSKWNPVRGPKHLKFTYKEQIYENYKINCLDTGYFDIIKPPGYFSNGLRFN